jgi:hypothetical protein
MGDNFSVVERCKVAAWIEAFGNVAEDCRRIEEEFGKDPSSHLTVYAIHRRFIDNGNIHDCSCSGWSKSTRCDDNIEVVSEMILRSPTTSIRRASEEAGILHSSVHIIMKIDLKLKPYRFQMVHELYPEDEDRGEEMCFLFSKKIFEKDDGDQFVSSLWFSDEATFRVPSIVNRHSCVIWSEENPRTICEYEQNSPKLYVWCAIS